MYEPINRQKPVNSMIIISFLFLIKLLNLEISFIANGSTSNPPIMNLMFVKVSGPTNSIPVVWATKAVPHIKAAPIKHRVAVNCFENIN